MFAQKYTDSGYDVAFQEEVLKATIRKHYHDVAKAQNKGNLYTGAHRSLIE